MIWLQVVGGLVLLFIGGEVLVRGAVSLARRLGVAPLAIGLTVVGFGTSAPELVVSVDASLRGVYDIAVGNVVGSNIANILLILGVSVIIFPIVCDRRAFYRDGMIMLGTTIAFVGLASAGVFYRWEGVLMLAALAGYLAYCYRDERRRGRADPAAELHIRESEEVPELPGRAWVAALASLAGLALLVAGSNLLVEGAVALARTLGVSEAVIGITLVALGTSLPELATAVVAAMRRHSDVALGNVIGSNMFNLLGVMGAAAVAHPVTVSPEFLHADLWVLLAVTFLMLVFMARGLTLTRANAALLLLAYVIFVVAQFGGLLGLPASATGAGLP